MTAESVARAELRPGYTISRLIKGGWQLAGGHGEVERGKALEAMREFVDAGVDTFDCADIYTGVEALLGEFVDKLRGDRGEAALRQVKIHTKLVPDLDRLQNLERGYIDAVVERSLQRLRLPRLDLVQFHWWDYAIPGWLEALAALQQLRRAGKIDRIGVTNFDAGRLDEMVYSGVDIVSAQVQYSLLDRRPAGAFTELCRRHDIALLCYGVLAGGFITAFWLGRPDPGYAFANRSLVKYRLIIDEFGGWKLFQALLTVLHEIAERHRVSIPAVAIRHTLDRPQVSAVIVGARYADRLKDTLAAFTLELDDEDGAAIDSVLARSRGPAGPVYGLERDREGRHGRIMKYRLNR